MLVGGPANRPDQSFEHRPLDFFEHAVVVFIGHIKQMVGERWEGALRLDAGNHTVIVRIYPSEEVGALTIGTGQHGRTPEAY